MYFTLYNFIDNTININNYLIMPYPFSREMYDVVIRKNVFEYTEKTKAKLKSNGINKIIELIVILRRKKNENHT